MEQYNVLLGTYEKQLKINENKLQKETLNFNNSQINNKLFEFNNYSQEQNHQGNLNNILENLKYKITTLDKEIYSKEREKIIPIENDNNVNPYVIKINEIDKINYDLENTKNINIEILKQLNDEKNDMEKIIFSEIKDSENLESNKNEISKQGILKYHNKLTILESQIKLYNDDSKNNIANPCNNSHDVLKFLKNKGKRKKKINDNKNNIKNIDLEIIKLDEKFIIDAGELRDNLNTTLENINENVNNKQKKIEILEYEYNQIESKKKSLEYNINNLNNKPKTDFIEKLILKNINKLDKNLEEQLLLSEKTTQNYNNLSNLKESIKNINKNYKINIENLLKNKNSKIKKLEETKNDFIINNKEIIQCKKIFKNVKIAQKSINSELIKQQELYTNIDFLQLQINKINSERIRENNMIDRNIKYLEDELKSKTLDIQNRITLLLEENNKIINQIDINNKKILELDIKKSEFINEKREHEIFRKKRLKQIECLYNKRQELINKLEQTKERIKIDETQIQKKRNVRSSNNDNIVLKSNLKIINLKKKISEIKDQIYKLKKVAV